MSEFDFEELDKAVTGALAGKDSSAQKDDASEPSQQHSPQPKEEPSRPAVAMPAARRGTPGRFMDVVHPSSDMRRTTTSVTPQSEATKASETPVSPSVAQAPEAPRAPKVPQHPVSTLPEPPNFQAEAEKAAEDHSDTTEPWQAPLESPFLTGAKVEKRPLGAVPRAPSDALEEELLLEAPDEPRLEAHASPDAENIEPSSITQQYKERSRADGGTEVEFDNEAYHQPITHPAKKRSSLWTILWILLLVILGAGAGVVFYLYVLPQL